jgi:hypothetical protein
LIRQYLIESFVVALAAVAAWYGTPLLLHFSRDPMMFESISVRPDGMVFWAALPALRAASVGPIEALRAE